MADLTTKKRKSLKKSQFAVPGERKYPIHDKSHAQNALSRVSQFGTPAEKAQVRAAVAKKFPGVAQSKGPQAKKTGGKKKKG